MSLQEELLSEAIYFQANSQDLGKDPTPLNHFMIWRRQAMAAAVSGDRTFPTSKLARFGKMQSDEEFLYSLQKWCQHHNLVLKEPKESGEGSIGW